MVDRPDLTDCPSPNFGDRRGGARPDLIVLHYTAMDSVQAALDRLCDRRAGVSAHYLISETGLIYRLVAEDKRAWHAGAGAWGAVGDVNSRSIGIELANPGDAPFPEPQMAALEWLLADVMGRCAILPERVIGHSDMAPGRKRDPGPRFGWRRLAAAGLSVWPRTAGASGARARGRVDADFLRALGRIGYPAAPPEALTEAFRLRFRPRHDGPPDLTDLALAADLAVRFPVDRAGSGG